MAVSFRCIENSSVIRSFALPDSDAENAITVDTNAYSGLTTYYANGNPVVIEEVGGTTYIHPEDVSDMDQWTEMASSKTAVVAGSKEGDVDQGKITMNSGTVTYLIGSSSGSKSAPSYYHVKDSEIVMNGGAANNVIANYSITSGNGAYETCRDMLVENSKITIGGNAVVGYVYGCFGYTAIDNWDILIKDNARVVWTSSNEAAVTVQPAEGNPFQAVVTGNDIGAAVVTASYTAEGKTEKTQITVSVGGDFSVSVNPSAVKMGDTITFTANTDAVASASNADYVWTIDDTVVAEEMQSSGKTFKAKAAGVGSASVQVVYTDMYGTESIGNAAFTVEAPEMEITVPESVELGKPFKASAAITNVSGEAETLGITVQTYEACEALEALENDNEYMAVDVPADGEPAVISARMEYPAKAGENGQDYTEKTIRITVPKLSGETIYLNTTNAKEKTIKAPALIGTLYDHMSFTEFSVRDDEAAQVR